MRPKNSPAMLNEEGATSEAQLLELLALRAAGLPPRMLLRLFLSDEAKPAELPLDLPTDINCYREMIERSLPLAEEELARCRQAGITLLPYFASDYPVALHALGGSRPVLLHAKGDLGLLQSPASILGIVGTRQPSPEGLAAAHRIAYEEAEKGRVILSGLAYGCDAAAHHGHSKRQGVPSPSSPRALTAHTPRHIKHSKIGSSSRVDLCSPNIRWPRPSTRTASSLVTACKPPSAPSFSSSNAVPKAARCTPCASPKSTTARSSHSLPTPTASPRWRGIGSSSNQGALSPGKSALYAEGNFRICAAKFLYIRK